MFDIDLQSRTPIYEQLYKRVAAMTVRRELKSGDKLPSVRELAKELGVNPNTVSKAFQMLERDGLINSVPGRGSFISADNADSVRKISRENFASAVRAAASSGLTAEDMVSMIGEIFSSFPAASMGNSQREIPGEASGEISENISENFTGNIYSEREKNGNDEKGESEL